MKRGRESSVARQIKDGTYQRLFENWATCPYCKTVVTAPVNSSTVGNQCQCGVLEVLKDDKGAHYRGETPCELVGTSAPSMSEQERESVLGFISFFNHRNRF